MDQILKAEDKKKLRVLIIHQNFPGQFRHIANYLASQPNVEVLGLGRETAPGLPNVKCIKYRPHRNSSKSTHVYTQQMESAVLHGQAVVKVLYRLKKKGFEPDVILAHPGWGETLYLREVYPQTKFIHFCEWFYSPQGADLGFDPEFPSKIDDRLKVTTWNAHHLLSLEQCDIAISPTDWQKSQYPATYHHKIRVAHEGVDVNNLRPDASAKLTMPNGITLRSGDPVITYVARNLEPYRGFHIFMRTLPALLARHPACHVVIVGGDGVSYGHAPKDAAHWREKLLKEIKLEDLSHVHFLGKVPYTVYQKVLQISAAHIYLTYPFVLSWSLLEAMATGCAVIASNTAPVKEVVQHGKNGLLVDFFSSKLVLDNISHVLSDRTYAHDLRRAAMQTVKQTYNVEQGLQRYLKSIIEPFIATQSSTIGDTSKDAVQSDEVQLNKSQQIVVNKIIDHPNRRVTDKAITQRIQHLGFTQREVEILKCLSQGMEDKAISVHLLISPKTVSNHVSSIINKLGVNNRTHAVAKVFYS